MDDLKEIIKRNNNAIDKLKNLFYLLENSRKLEKEKMKLEESLTLQKNDKFLIKENIAKIIKRIESIIESNNEAKK